MFHPTPGSAADLLRELMLSKWPRVRLIYTIRSQYSTLRALSIHPVSQWSALRKPQGEHLEDHWRTEGGHHVPVSISWKVCRVELTSSHRPPRHALNESISPVRSEHWVRLTDDLSRDYTALSFPWDQQRSYGT